MQPGVSTRSFTGNVGRYSSASIGIQSTQGVQLGLIGAYVSLGTDYYLTNQTAPPYERGMQTFSIAVGPRLALSLEPMRFFLGVEYANLGVVSNALTRYTGEQLAFDAIGVTPAVRFEALLPLYVEVGGVARRILDMDEPTWSLGVVLSLGIAGSL